MSLAHHPLPTDPQALRSFAADLQAELARKDIEIAANAAEIHAKTLHIEKLKMQLAVLRRARFGRSSEKLDHATGCGFLEAVEFGCRPPWSWDFCRRHRIG
jgi:transposase